MTRRIGWCVLFSLMTVAPAWAQTYPPRQDSPGGAMEPDQPVRPRSPTLVQRGPQQPAAQPQPPKAPFTLSPQEEAQVDRVLKEWETRNLGIKTIDMEFTRWTYDLVFNPPEPNKPLQPKFVEQGVIRYESPAKGLFRIDSSVQDGKATPIDNARAEHWICDGKSVFEYSPSKKQVIEHKLPKELQGKAIANSPLPFLFGAEAQRLKERYWIRLASNGANNQIELVAYPRFQQDAANFDHAVFIISKQKMEPFALQIIQPNGKDKTSYQFQNIVINDSLRFLKGGDPFRAFTPLGWQRIVEEPPAAQAQRVPTGQR